MAGKGGRPKGVPNKATRDVREAMAQIAQRGVSKFWTWLEKIEDPAAKCRIYLDVLEYHIPKLARTEVTGPQGTKLEITLVSYADSSTAEQLGPAQLPALIVESPRSGH